MRNLAAPSTSGPASRRGSTAGLASTLSSPNQARYKGLISTPGITKFSAWKRDCEIPKIPFHEFLLKKIDEKPGDRVWLKDVSMGRVETFGGVKKTVMRVASGLTKLGFVKGDVMCLYCPNYVDFWILGLAAWSCGGCVMPINCEVEKSDFSRQVELAGPKLVVCDSYNIGDVLEVASEVCQEVIKHVLAIGANNLDDFKDNPKVISVSDLLSDDGKNPPSPSTVRNAMRYESDVIYLPFTSTSGDGGSVGVRHTNKSLMSMFYSPDGAANHWFDQAVGDSVACGNWFYHLTGLYSFALASIYGLSLYTLSDYSDAAFMDMIVDYKIATASLYTWQVRMLSQSPEVSLYDLSSLKVLVTGSSLLSSTIRVEVMDRIPSVRYVRESYGLNECGLVTLTYPRDAKKSSASSSSAGVSAADVPDDHVMPVGLPNMYTQIKVKNRLSGDAVSGPEEQGEICIKSPQNFLGYLNAPNTPPPDVQQKFDSDGFFCTGDLGYYDSQGVVYFIESIANLIHFWMYEVAPSILESRLLGSNNILDAAVVAIPDKENGQVPRAFVVLRPGIEETEENVTNLMESRLQDHERIRGGLYFIQAIPRDENWKVRRDLLVDYKPRTTEELNQEFLDEENASKAASTVDVGATGSEESNKSPSGGDTSDVFSAAADNSNKVTDEERKLHREMALEVARSPKLATKSKPIKELSKQPNGSFVSSGGTSLIQEALSPKPTRSTKIKTSGYTESMGVVSGCGTGGMGAIPEDSSSMTGMFRKTSGETSAAFARQRSSTSSRYSESRSRGSSRRGSAADIQSSTSANQQSAAATTVSSQLNHKPKKTFSYWMKMTWDPESLQDLLMSHSCVSDCTVQDFNIDGIGSLPRAYVVVKTGYSVTSDELLHYLDSKATNEASKLRAGIVFVDKLAKDPSGKLFISLEKFNKDAEGMDYGIIRGQPKVKISQD